MLVSPIENFVLLSTIFAVACFTVASGLRLLIQRRFLRLRTVTLIRVYTLALVLPPLLALWIVAAAFLPELWMPEAFSAAHNTPHQLHLLGDLTARVEPTLAYMILLFATGAALFAAWCAWNSYIRVAQLISNLQTNAEPAEPCQLAIVEDAGRRYGLEVGLVMSDYPFSFVWGFSRSKLIVSSGLLHTLNEAELTGLLEHEAAHHQRRDNLVKLALSFCSYASLGFPFARRILAWRGFEVEQMCDEIASSRTNEPLDIASALVKLRRQTSPARVAVSSFIAEDVSSFRSRVSRLIDLDDNTSINPASGVRSEIRFAITAGVLFIASLFVSVYFFPLGFHRALESLIQLLA